MMIGTVGLGGAEMVALQLALALRAKGYVVHPVVPLGHEGWLVDEFQANGFICHRYDLRRAIDPGLPRRLAKTLADLGVDVVHSHEFTMAVYGAAAARRIGKPHIITMHANQTTADKFLRRVAMRWAFRHSRATIAVSDDTRRDMESRIGVREGVIQVIPNGMPEVAGNREAARKELGVAPNDVVLLSIGSLTPRKAHATLLEALILLKKRNGGDESRWRLAIAGEGPERPRLEQMIRENGLSQRVQLLGKRSDIADLQAGADLFVLPSLWEGLPLAILEAMFGGNAVIASNVSGIPEAIAHGKHGLLTPPGDAAALADAISTLVRDPERRQAMAGAALERARKEFTIEAMTSAYERLYHGRPDDTN